MCEIPFTSITENDNPNSKNSFIPIPVIKSSTIRIITTLKSNDTSKVTTDESNLPPEINSQVEAVKKPELTKTDSNKSKDKEAFGEDSENKDGIPNLEDECEAPFTYSNTILQQLQANNTKPWLSVS